MSGAPVARRYWFVDRAGLAALAAAIDPPDWGGSDVPTTVFCEEAGHRAMIKEAAGDDAGLRFADPGEFASELDRENARYLQFAFAPLEDFGPGLELVVNRLAGSSADLVTVDVVAIGQCATALVEGGEPVPEACWVRTDLLRASEGGEPRAVHAAAIQAASETIRLPLIAGGVFTGEPGDEAASWRARAAAAWAEVDRLGTERRARQGRELALKARHERALARQAARIDKEIDRLHRAAGWAGRWRARFARWLRR